MTNQKSLFEDFTTLKWVKWTKRTPTFNGSIYVRWNGKYTSNGMVHNGHLTSLDGDKTGSEYTESQKKILEDLYWLEETHDLEGLTTYQESLSE